MQPTPTGAVTVPAPPAHLDARNRALRTFLQGLLAVLLSALVTVILDWAGTIRMTREWWTAFGAALGTAALTALVSYVTRYTHPPQV